LEYHAPTLLVFPPTKRIRDRLDQTLQLLFGIGPRHSETLQREGYGTLTALRAHPRWGNGAIRLLEEWGDPPHPEAVFRALAGWLPASHSLTLAALGLAPRDGLLFFDLETLGLSNAPVFLIATARPCETGVHIRQTLATSLAGERSLLEEFAAELETASALISYNGKAFDWSFLRERFAYYGLPYRSVPIHVDLLHHVRRRFAGAIADAHLGTVETSLLGIRRENDLPSALVPQFYAMYLETGSAAPLIPVLHHNRQDIITLVVLLQRLLGEAVDDAR
jgi:uncharacterized protein YprB with RNaseH-like and TPR domain